MISSLSAAGRCESEHELKYLVSVDLGKDLKILFRGRRRPSVSLCRSMYENTPMMAGGLISNRTVN